MLGNSRMFWNVRAMPEPVTWCGRGPEIRSPPKRTSPSVGVYTPVTS